MARGFTQYSYNDDKLPDEWPLHSAHLDYILDDGTRLNVNQADYYCPNCNHFVVGERIETVSALEQEINDIENAPQSRRRMLAEVIGNIPQQIAELHIRIRWRKNRKAPPKCLQCGCTQILPIPDYDEFNHPQTGQPMKRSGRGFATTTEWHATYTPEGDQIESS